MVYKMRDYFSLNLSKIGLDMGSTSAILRHWYNGLPALLLSLTENSPDDSNKSLGLADAFEA